jgi:biotin carboxyl carrier protein
VKQGVGKETTDMQTRERAMGHRPVWLRVIVAPSPGRVRLLPPIRFHDGHEWVHQGQPVARIEHGTGNTEVVAPIDGRVTSVLAVEGEPVVAGQPVMAIEEQHAE